MIGLVDQLKTQARHIPFEVPLTSNTIEECETGEQIQARPGWETKDTEYIRECASRGLNGWRYIQEADRYWRWSYYRPPPIACGPRFGSAS